MLLTCSLVLVLLFMQVVWRGGGGDQEDNEGISDGSPMDFYRGIPLTTKCPRNPLSYSEENPIPETVKTENENPAL